jgi:hypothetical protein
MATTTNYGWTTPDDTGLVKDGASAIRTLGSSVDTTTKNLNPSTTLGDIEYRSSTSNVNTRLGIGTTGQILTVASGVPSWGAAPTSGGMTLLSTTTCSGMDFTISSISQSYKTLYVLGRGTNRASTASIRITPRNGSTDLSTMHQLLWTTNSINQTNSPIYPDANNGQISNSAPCNFVLVIDNYSDTTYQKPFTFYGSFFRSGSDVVGFNANGSIISTSAVNALNFYSDQAFNAGQILVYGVN